jgi:hypothetical protein
MLKCLLKKRVAPGALMRVSINLPKIALAAACAALAACNSIEPTANGSCGGAYGVAVRVAPTTNLCIVGTASSMAGSGPWSWSCVPSDPHGVTAQCSAPVATPRVGEKLDGDTNRPNNSTFALGEAVELTFNVSGLPPSEATVLALNIVDELGHAIASLTVPISANAAGDASATTTVPASKLGYYRVDAAMADGTSLTILGTRPAGFLTYAVVPDPVTRVNYGDAASRFGLQGGFSTQQGAVIPYLGVRYVLGSAGGWAALEPQHTGQFAVNRALALSAGQPYPPKSPVMDEVTYQGVAWPTFSVPQIVTTALPSWAGPVAGTAGTQCTTFGALNPEGIAGLPGFASAYAKEVAADYPDQSTHYYQVHWEPELPWCFGGTPAQLVQYYQLVYAAIHQADPKAAVAGPTLFSGGADFAQMSNLWSAGLGRYLDAQSMHPYATWPPETNGLVSNVRKMMQMAAAAVGHSIPFIGTEHGLPSGQVGELDQALGNVRTTIILLGEGFKFDFAFYVADFWNSSPSETDHTFGYYWNLNPKIIYGTDKIGPKPAVPSYAAMTYILDGTTSAGALSNLSGTQMGYRFQRDSTTILALWDYQAASSTINIAVPSSGMRECDWMGNCSSQTGSNGSLSVRLGAAPVYLIGRGL